MDLDGVRTFVAVADAGQFQGAAAALSITQQAVSKRIAVLETSLGVRLFARTPRGAELTREGRLFLPHARELLATYERARSSVRPERRPLRVDVVSAQVGPARLLREFHTHHPEVEIQMVTHVFDVEAALQALRSGCIDATFRAVPQMPEQLADTIGSRRALDDPLELLTSDAHPLAAAPFVTPDQLAACDIWMPSNVPGTEWSSYYDELAARFGVRIDTAGPNFGIDALVERVAHSSTLATILGEHIRISWPSKYALRRIPIRNPMLVYPHSMLWRVDDTHPGLAELRGYVASKAKVYRHRDAWCPSW